MKNDFHLQIKIYLLQCKSSAMPSGVDLHKFPLQEEMEIHSGHWGGRFHRGEGGGDLLKIITLIFSFPEFYYYTPLIETCISNSLSIAKRYS